MERKELDQIVNGVLAAAVIAGAVLTYRSDMSIELFMLLLVVIGTVVWLLDRFFLKRRRPAGEKAPHWIEYSRDFLPVILAVFFLRSFLVEPFKIPSSSMMPTLLVGDFILVNKFDYGIRLPVADMKIFNVGEPKRGDVMVFRYPNNPSEDFIKRVVGVPGDVIIYRDKKLTINGVLQQQTDKGEYNSPRGTQQTLLPADLFTEDLDGHKHSILRMPARPSMDITRVEDFPHRENCEYTLDQMRCKVPPGYYFMMGDNRDNSHDSRYWGFVPDRNIVGKAFAIWFNWHDLKRIGTSIN